MPQQLPPLGALRAVEAIGRHASMTQAARALGVTPGALSHQLRGLEERLGLALFDRTGRALVPTEAGRRLLPVLSDAFQRMADAIADVSGQRQSTITISCGLAFAAKWLVSRLVGWTARHPTLEARIVTTSRLVDFEREDIDLAIRFGRGGWPGLRSELLIKQPIFPACAPAWAAKLRRPADLARLPLIEDEQSLFGWDRWRRHSGLSAPYASIRRFPDASLAIEAALSGQGVCLTWPLIAADALASGRLVKPLAETCDADLGYWCVTTDARWRRKPVQQFKAWLQSTMVDAPLPSVEPAHTRRRRSAMRRV